MKNPKFKVGDKVHYKNIWTGKYSRRSYLILDKMTRWDIHKYLLKGMSFKEIPYWVCEDEISISKDNIEIVKTKDRFEDLIIK